MLAADEPRDAAGAVLALVRATIAPGAGIPAHEHPDTQLATVVSGELTYTVLTGEVPVTRG